MFEFDPAKSQANKQKHGISFEAAQALWSDPDRLGAPVRTSDEPCFLVIGRISDQHWSAAITFQVDRIRILSVRRAHEEEVAAYESNRI